MENPYSNLVVFVYTVGVLLTGMWVAEPSWPDLTPVRLGLLGAVGLFWTVYFGWTVGPRLVDLETPDDEDDDEPPDPTEPDL